MLVIKGGMMDGKILTADDIKKLAKLESREVLLSRIAGAANATLAKAAALFQAPLSQAARTIAALEAKVAAADTTSGVVAPEVNTETLAPAPAVVETAEAPADAPAEVVAEEATTDAPQEEAVEASAEAVEAEAAPAAEESTEG
jgi:large subunit ribosomal protein L10